jgi:hypothetical protein
MTADSTPTSLPAHIQLAGLGLILREWADGDLPVMVELFDDPQVDHWTPLRSPFDLIAVHAYLDKARQDRAAGRRLQLAITTDGYHPRAKSCSRAPATTTAMPNSPTPSAPYTAANDWPPARCNFAFNSQLHPRGSRTVCRPREPRRGTAPGC